VVKILEEMSSARVESKPQAWPHLKESFADADSLESVTSVEEELEILMARVKAKKAQLSSEPSFPLRSMTTDKSS